MCNSSIIFNPEKSESCFLIIPQLFNYQRTLYIFVFFVIETCDNAGIRKIQKYRNIVKIYNNTEMCDKTSYLNLYQDA